jgi:hypothetical protein
MENFYHLLNSYAWFIPLIIICVTWDTAWKLIGMWKAGRNNELAWFLCIAIFNTMGILPIIYIMLSRSNKEKISTAE